MMMTGGKQVSDGMIEVSFRVNGRENRVTIERRAVLLDTLRDELQLTGAKKGCGEGVCGACTVLVNGKAVCSCLMFTAEAQGTEILTIEGLSAGQGDVDPLQRAFMENDALQCGYCTSGQILAAKSFLNSLKRGDPIKDSEISEALEGNLCRCGAYNNIVKAVREIAATIVK